MDQKVLNQFKLLLDQVIPEGEKEEKDLQKLKEFFLANQLNSFNNENYNDGHITGSAFIYDPLEKRILLLHHKKLNRWLQPGGHSDSNPDIVATATREVLEETGVTEFECDKTIFDIDIHEFPAREGKNPKHYHYDVRFLFIVDSNKPLVRNIEETNDLKWIDLNEIWDYVNPNEEAFKRVVEKLSKYKNK